jgi:hypothetical protein
MDWPLSGVYELGGRFWLDVQIDADDNTHTPIKCPYGVVGDRLYVRETWKPTKSYVSCLSYIRYLADDSRRAVGHSLGGSGIDKWRPSIHMPKWASRIWLEITDIRVERVQDITYSNMKAEGCIPDNVCGGYVDKLRERYWKPLWDSINAKKGYGWQINPWVWVISFKVLE